MLYQLNYSRTAEGGQDTSYSQTVEGPAHRRGVVPRVLVDMARDLGYVNGADAVEVCVYAPLKVGRDGTRDFAVSTSLGEWPIP